MPSSEGPGMQSRAHALGSWPAERFCGPVIKAESHPVVPGFSEGLGGVFILVIHSPGKIQHNLTNLFSEKSGNLIALYSLVNDIV